MIAFLGFAFDIYLIFLLLKMKKSGRKTVAFLVKTWLKFERN